MKKHLGLAFCLDTKHIEELLLISQCYQIAAKNMLTVYLEITCDHASKQPNASL